MTCKMILDVDTGSDDTIYYLFMEYHLLEQGNAIRQHP